MSQRESCDDVVEQHLEVGVDRVVPRQLRVEVPGEDLDVAGLVHHLGRGVVLGVDPRHGLDDLRGADQRALLAVHELRQRPVLRLDPELDPLLVAPLLERRAGEVVHCGRSRSGSGCSAATFSWSTSMSHGRSLRVPLRRLRLLVELAERGPAALVVPREDRVGVGVHRVRDLVDVAVGDREDRLEVVDVGATDDLGVVSHRGLLTFVPSRAPRAS